MTPSAITKVRVKFGSDGQAYYTTLYANGEEGSRSQGYGTACDPEEVPATAEANLAAARMAAERDYPDVDAIITDDSWPPAE